MITQLITDRATAVNLCYDAFTVHAATVFLPKQTPHIMNCYLIVKLMKV